MTLQSQDEISYGDQTMKIIVSGGTGLIGNLFVQNMVGDGHEVIILSRSPDRYDDVFGEHVQLVQWDGRNTGDWITHIEGADAVVNLAGESSSGSGFLPDRWSAEKKQRILDSRVAAGEALAAAVEIADSKPDVLVQASAVGYYGSTGDTVITESSPPGQDFLASVTVDWESSTEAIEDMGVRHIIARLGLVLSTEDGALPRLLLPSRLFAGGWFGSGEQWWPWIHINDTVRALRFLIENEAAKGPFNITAPNPVTNRNFGKALGRALDRPSVMPVPAFALRMALGEVASTVLEGQRAVPQRLLEMGFMFRYADIDMALNNLIHE
jgi:uncharacterized protein (TIGR01777 family)